MTIIEGNIGIVKVDKILLIYNYELFHVLCCVVNIFPPGAKIIPTSYQSYCALSLIYLSGIVPPPEQGEVV